MKFKSSKPGASFAWRWHYGLRTLKKAYESSRIDADKEIADINMRAEKHENLVAAAKASWDEYDEDGNFVYNYGENLAEEMHDVESVLSLVRLAFVISLHHFVEQRLARELPRKENGELHYVQSAAFDWLKHKGWPAKENELKALRLAANCAKHSEGRSAKELFELQPDMFDKDKIDMGFEPGYESLALTDMHLLSLFEAVRTSVPDNLGIAL